MKEKHNKINRRNFLKTVGATGLGSVFVSSDTLSALEQTDAAAKAKKPKYPQVPKRKLGKTGVKLPCLCLGGNQDLIANQIVLRRAPQLGVTYWDTAHNYTGGNSELGIGKILSKNPQARKKLFISSKASRARSIAQVEERLQTSLKRMNTDYIDLYYGYHQCPNPAFLTNELKEWAENAKKRKLIRHFGISTHQNMADVLAAAARLDWIEVVMTIYNFRLMQDKKLNAAIEACHKAGKGIMAIKTLGMGQKITTDEDKKLTAHFLQRGFTKEQAKIKAVLQDKRFTAVCVGMQNMALLTSNVAAALDKTKLTQADTDALTEYAHVTCDGYCAGCANICNSILPDAPHINDIMRYLMYYNNYGEHDEARQLFAQIPGKVRNKLLSMDYRQVEARCPQHLPVAKLVAEAVHKLA
ncbi:MAG TPA: aldo/keto reductase [Sedimentisphaerales bacterium]|nr:aldo/keto reductase [Sedimentisphaerales bacterium]